MNIIQQWGWIWVGPKRVLATVLRNIVLAGFCCSLVTSCKDADDVLAPVDLPPPPASLLDLFGNVLYEADGNVVDLKTIEDKAIIAIYFGAGWCSACGGFTPLLTDFYEELDLADKSFAVVFVSFDRSEAEMFEHMTDRAMPWSAVPYGGEEGAALTQRYEVLGIPMLVVIDGEGNTITTSGRPDVVTYGAAAYETWLAMSGG